MAQHPRAGQPAQPEDLCNIPRLVASYYTEQVDANDPAQQVAFGTSGHRGSSLRRAFNEPHILAIAQAISEYRQQQGTTGPLYVGIDTHALSEPAYISAVEVLAANGVQVRVQAGRGFTPTPVISHAIITYNRGRDSGLADGVVITPSHNPPEDGGFKYNPPHGGPADSNATGWIQDRANDLLRNDLKGLNRMTFDRAMASSQVEEVDMMQPYIDDLDQVLDLDSVKAAGLHIGVDPLGGSGVEFWPRIAERYGLNIERVNRLVDPAFSFMTLDKDGKIRMDCSSPFAMASLIDLKDKFDIAVANDPDNDRHGIVTPTGGLMNPNHYLAVCINYLYRNRPQWPAGVAVGKTLVSSSMIDHVAKDLGATLAEVPVGFKWFVDGLSTGTFGFGGEESAGASFLRKDGSAWTTDKDGILLALLAAEITAVTGKDPSQHYQGLVDRFGAPVYQRLDAPATTQQKKVLANLSPDMVEATSLAGDAITAKLTHAPGNGAAIGGLKVVTEHGWFAARPSGTEEIYKIYTESFRGDDHLKQIQQEAQAMVSDALAKAGS